MKMQNIAISQQLVSCHTQAGNIQTKYWETQFPQVIEDLLKALSAVNFVQVQTKQWQVSFFPKLQIKAVCSEASGSGKPQRKHSFWGAQTTPDVCAVCSPRKKRQRSVTKTQLILPLLSWKGSGTSGHHLDTAPLRSSGSDLGQTGLIISIDSFQSTCSTEVGPLRKLSEENQVREAFPLRKKWEPSHWGKKAEQNMVENTRAYLAFTKSILTHHIVGKIHQSRWEIKFYKQGVLCWQIFWSRS